MEFLKFSTFAITLGLILATFVGNSHQIVGGEPIFRGEYNSIVSIRVGGVHKCGGTILAKTPWQFVLTAASCVYNEQISNIQVVAGEHSLSLDDGTEQISDVRRIRVHNYFNPDTVEDDVAVIQLASNFTEGEFVGRLSIYTGTTYPRTGATIGWGASSIGGGPEDQPKKVDYNFFSDEQCATYHPNFVPNKMLCGGWQSGGEDVCTGDVGAISYQRGTGLLGLVPGQDSSCGRQHMLGLYTRLKYYIPWVDLQVAQMQQLP